MPVMLLFALQLSLLEARLRLIRATLASCLSRLPLHRFPLCRERLLCHMVSQSGKNSEGSS